MPTKIGLVAIALSMGCAAGESAPARRVEIPTNPAQMERVTQQLVAPPFVPVHDQVAAGPPKIVQVRMVVGEKLVDVGPDGAKVWAMSFNGTVPGPLIVVHQDDQVEVTLVNPATNTLVHNVDFHAASGALGGAELTYVGPGQEVVLRFKATKAGVFVYHCAPGGPMIPFHVVSGMNGAIMVLPRDGLRDAEGRPVKYDRAYYVGEQDYYLPRDAKGKYREYPIPGGRHDRHDERHENADAHPCGLQRSRWGPDWRGGPDGVGGGAGAVHPLAGEPGLPAPPHRRARRSPLERGVFRG